VSHTVKSVKGCVLTMAKIEDIMEQHADALKDSPVNKDSFSSIQTKLNELGYDVLLNHKEKAEFVPSSRLGEIASQRDTFKTQVDGLNSELESMKKSAGGNQELQAQLQAMIDKNNASSVELEKAKIQAEFATLAKDAINTKDLLLFVDFSNVKINSKGEVIGVDAEIARLQKDKPYLFNGQANQNNRGGTDGSGTGGGTKASMNSMIRRAAGHF